MFGHAISIPTNRLPPPQSPDPMAKFPGQLARPPCPSRSLVAVKPPRYQRSTATLQHQKPLHHFVWLFSGALPTTIVLRLACWPLQDEAPLQPPTISGSPPASDCPPGLSPGPDSVAHTIDKASFLRDPFDRQSWRSWLVACAAVPNTGENMEYMRCCAVHCLRIAALPLQCDTAASIAGFSLRPPM